jgi:hypothetical protein
MILLATIPFPLEDVPALRKGKKTVTLRMDQEHGKYHKGETYEATTYNGDPLGLTIWVLEVVDTIVSCLPGLGVPRGVIKRLEKEGGINTTRVDYIRFELVQK